MGGRPEVRLVIVQKKFDTREGWLYILEVQQNTPQFIEVQVLERIKSSFSSLHGTLFSIIQGIVLGFLANRTYSLMVGEETVNSIQTIFPFIFLSFLFIVVVTYNYLLMVALVRWYFNFVDILMAFLLGISQIAPLFFLDDPKMWYLYSAFFALISAGNYLVVWRKVSRSKLNSPWIVNELNRIRKKQILILIMMSLMCSLASLITDAQTRYIVFESGVWLFINVTGFMMVFRTEKVVQVIHRRLKSGE